MPNYVVMFNKNNAHIIKNVEDTEPYYNMSNALVNPSLKNIQRVHTMFWTQSDGKLKALSKTAQKRRAKKVKEQGLDMSIKPEYKFPLYLEIIAVLTIIGVAYATLSRYF